MHNCGPHSTVLRSGELMHMPTVSRSACGHVRGAPCGVFSHWRDRIKSPTLPPPCRNSEPSRLKTLVKIPLRLLTFQPARAEHVADKYCTTRRSRSPSY